MPTFQVEVIHGPGNIELTIGVKAPVEDFALVL
jgi:hypothetical protein